MTGNFAGKSITAQINLISTSKAILFKKTQKTVYEVQIKETE